MKTTLVLGASEKHDRYSNMAVKLLNRHQISIVAIGQKNSFIDNIPIIKKDEFDFNQAIHTITLYLNPKRQIEYYDFILKVKPQRIIFNPGTENDELHSILKSQNIECEEACTLVLLNTGQF